MIDENRATDREGFFEKASEQIHRERKGRKDKRNTRQAKKMQLLARRHGIRIEKERRAIDEEMKSAGIWKRIRWWFVKAWRKLFLTG